MSPEKPRRLGRGLDALLGQRPTETPTPRTESPHGAATTEPAPAPFREIPVSAIQANHYQPRKEFRADELKELADSIRGTGLLQPITVRAIAGADRYELVAGERRLRAVRSLGWERIPAIVRNYDDRTMLTLALVENLQREDLNPIETAQAFSRMADELSLTAEEIGQRTGKDRTTITNFLRLLALPTDLQQLIGERRLSAGHARCLLTLPGPELQREVAEKAVAQGWSVRQTERMTQRMMADRKPKHVDEVEIDPNVKAAIQEMERILGTKVRIVEKAKQKGKIEIEYYSADDLDRIYSTIVGEQ